jgi:2-amino-4-hydroxy-6-hydroxymethyldihydropteridine diphosphokinase
MADETQAILLLGGNIGDRVSYIQLAHQLIGEIYPIVTASSIYETAAWGDRNQQPYLNMALQIAVNEDAFQLFERTRNIEIELGRIEKGNFEPRTIDIDILFFGRKVIQTRSLTIPHERLHMRKFVLTPLNEIAPNWVHPILKKTVQTLLLECEDHLSVEKFNESKV